MKQVWIVNHYAQDPGGPGGTRHFMLARALREHGWEASLIAASVELNTQRQRLAPFEPARIEQRDGVRLCWVRTPEYRGSGVGRMRNMLSFARRLLGPRAVRGLPEPDAIIGSTVHPFAAAAAALLAARRRVPFLFEVRDIWPETLVALGRLRRYSPVTFVLAWLERWLCRRACRILAVMPGYAGHAAAFGVDPARVVYLPNGVDLAEVGPVAEYRKARPFRILYLGAHGTANDLGTLLEAMRLVADAPAGADIHCDLIGEGTLKPALEQQAARLGLDNVRFLPPVPKAQVYAAGRQAQAYIICSRALPSVYRFGVSMNKLFDYLAMGRPVIAALEALNNPVAEAGAGLSVAPEQPQVLAEAILRLAAMDETALRQMGLNGRAFVESQHEVRRLAARLAGVLDACVTAAAGGRA